MMENDTFLYIKIYYVWCVSSFDLICFKYSETPHISSFCINYTTYVFFVIILHMCLYIYQIEPCNFCCGYVKVNFTHNCKDLFIGILMMMTALMNPEGYVTEVWYMNLLEKNNMATTKQGLTKLCTHLWIMLNVVPSTKQTWISVETFAWVNINDDIHLSSIIKLCLQSD